MLGNMKMEQLEYFGIPTYLINIWKEHYSDCLLPVQEQAIRQFNLLSYHSRCSFYYQNLTQNRNFLKNLLVLSPSSSGKTLIGEIAALQDIILKKKVIYLVPLRILAEEKYRHFNSLYRSIGLNIRLSSHDHRYDDEEIVRGNFHIAIIVYEKFYYLLLQHPSFMNNVSLIIADEIQLINEPERGTRLENSFNYLKNNYPSVRIIALSAFTEYLLPLARWLEAELLTSSYRPVELRKGIVRNGIYRYQEHNSNITGEELFFPSEAAEECNLADYLKATLKFLLSKQETNLIFFSTKREVRIWSRWLAEELSLEPARTALAQLQALEDSTSKEELLNLLRHGIGYHCADLSYQERQALEEAVRSGEVKVICATGTLAMGVNLPVNNVILTGQKVTDSRYQTYHSCNCRTNSILPNYSRRALTVSEVENMGGRAGRLKVKHLKAIDSFGRIIFLAPSLIELSVYQKLYFSNRVSDAALSPSPLPSPLPSPTACYPDTALSSGSVSQNVLQDNHTSNRKSLEAELPGSIGFKAACSSCDSAAPSARLSANRVYCSTNTASVLAPDNPIVIQQDLLTFVLYRIAFGCQTFEEINEILETGRNKNSAAFWLHQFIKKYDEDDIRACLERLLQKDLIINPSASDHNSKQNYEISEIGQLVTAKGITFQTYTHFLDWIKKSEKENISELEVLLLIAASKDGRAFLIEYPGSGYLRSKLKNKNSSMYKWQEYLRLRFLSQIFEHGEEGKHIFKHYLKADSSAQEIGSPKRAKQSKNELHTSLAIKNVLLMHDWINGKEWKELEEEYGILAGSIQKIGEGFSWLADTLAALTAQFNWKEERTLDLEKIQQLSARLIAGINPEGLPLAKLQIPGLTRGYISRLMQEGYDRPSCLEELSEQQLAELLPALLVKKIKEAVGSDSDSTSIFNGSSPCSLPPIFGPAPAISIDGMRNRDYSSVLPNTFSDCSPAEQGQHLYQQRQPEFTQHLPEKGMCREALTCSSPSVQLQLKNQDKNTGLKILPKKNTSENHEPSPVLIIDLNRPDRIIFLQEEIKAHKIGFQLLLFLAQNQGKVISYEQVIDHLWPDDMDATYHRLWYHLRKLRNGIEKIILKQKGLNGQKKADGQNESNKRNQADKPERQISQTRSQNPASITDYLKEKIFKVIPGRGILLDEEVLLEIRE